MAGTVCLVMGRALICGPLGQLPPKYSGEELESVLHPMRSFTALQAQLEAASLRPTSVLLVGALRVLGRSAGAARRGFDASQGSHVL